MAVYKINSSSIHILDDTVLKRVFRDIVYRIDHQNLSFNSDTEVVNFLSSEKGMLPGVFAKIKSLMH